MCISFPRIISIPCTIPPPVLQSGAPPGEVSAVEGIKPSLSIYLHPLCLCLSLRQLASLELGWLLTLVSPGCYLSSKPWCWKDVSRFYKHSHKHAQTQMQAHTNKGHIVLLIRLQACIFQSNFNQWHLKWGCYTQARMPAAWGCVKHSVTVSTRTRLIQLNDNLQYGWHLTDLQYFHQALRLTQFMTCQVLLAALFLSSLMAFNMLPPCPRIPQPNHSETPWTFLRNQ